VRRIGNCNAVFALKVQR